MDALDNTSGLNGKFQGCRKCGFLAVAVFVEVDSVAKSALGADKRCPNNFCRSWAGMRFLPFAMFVVLLTIPTTLRGQQSAFISCAGKEKTTNAVTNVCDESGPVSLQCGQQVQVLENRGEWYKIRTADGHYYFIGFSALSYDRKRPVSVLLPDLGAANCFVNSGRPHPKAIYTPDPDYSKEAREAKRQGTVRLGFTVGKDGSVHDVKVVKSLGLGLDEKAVEAVQQWRFEPLTKYGEPVETTLEVIVNFRWY